MIKVWRNANAQFESVLILLQGSCLYRPICSLRVDPDGRCAALLVFGKQLVIIPFLRRDAVFDEHFAEPVDIKVF